MFCLCKLPFVSNDVLVFLQGYCWFCSVCALMEILRKGQNWMVLSIHPFPMITGHIPHHGPFLLWATPCHLLPFHSLLLSLVLPKLSPLSEDLKHLSSSPNVDLSTVLSGFCCLQAAYPLSHAAVSLGATNWLGFSIYSLYRVTVWCMFHSW